METVITPTAPPRALLPGALLVGLVMALLAAPQPASAAAFGITTPAGQLFPGPATITGDGCSSALRTSQAPYFRRGSRKACASDRHGRSSIRPSGATPAGWLGKSQISVSLTPKTASESR